MKKPNKTQRYCLTHLSYVWFFLFLYLYSSLYNLSIAVEKESTDNHGGTLIVEFFNDTDTSEIDSRCSGAYLSENIVLTAAHCFNEHTQQLMRIKCSGHQWQAAHLLVVRKHLEMDVAFAQLSNIDCDVNQINPSLPSIGQHVYVYKDGKKKSMTVESIDAFTFKVSDVKDCLIQGDSGMMAYATPFAVEDNSALGILISGQATCPAIQTFLRFDLINEWLFGENVI